MKELIGLDYDIRDLSWDELYDRAMEAIPQLLGEFQEKAENEKKPAVSICPRCGYEMPFNGREKKTVRCQNPQCKTLYLVDPSDDNPHNFRIVDEEYEKELQAAPKKEIKKGAWDIHMPLLSGQGAVQKHPGKHPEMRKMR